MTKPTLRQQRFVRAPLDDPAAFDHHHLLRLADSAQPLRNDEGRAIAVNKGEGFL